MHIDFQGYASNCTKISGMDISPYYLMYVRKLRLPLDLYLETQPANLHEKSHTTFIQHLKGRLQWVYEISSDGARLKNEVT